MAKMDKFSVKPPTQPPAQAQVESIQRKMETANKPPLEKLTSQLPKGTGQRIKLLAAEEEKKQWELTTEAFDLLFRKYSREPLLKEET